MFTDYFLFQPHLNQRQIHALYYFIIYLTPVVHSYTTNRHHVELTNWRSLLELW